MKAARSLDRAVGGSGKLLLEFRWCAGFVAFAADRGDAEEMLAPLLF